MRVFLVEDSERICTRIRAALDTQHIQLVGEAASQDDAIAMLDELKPDVAVIDLRLNSGNGFNVLKHINKKLPQITTIILTNHKKDEFAKPCFAAGADYYMEKSLHFPDFIQLLKHLNTTLKCKEGTF